jgi:hypothetical protein
VLLFSKNASFEIRAGADRNPPQATDGPGN